MRSHGGRILVVGASLGGLRVLRQLVAELPDRLAAPVLVVMHVGAHQSILPELLSSSGPLPATHAKHGEKLVNGRIYVAPPDHHMLVNAGVIHLTRTAKEHHTRPAIDPLFRSAALSYGAAVIGIVLSGRLDDGTAGLQAIKAGGGIAVVQDPSDAEEPSMPNSALRHVSVDHCLPATAIGRLCAELVDKLPERAWPMKLDDLQHEHDASLQNGDPMDHLNAIGKPSNFACPDCQGTLWELTSAAPRRYRCHTGHAFTLRTLIDAQSEAIEAVLWGALKTLNEQHRLLSTLATESGDSENATTLLEKAQRVQSQSQGLRNLIEKAS
jgi:two-component system, chemotaxis family, protein-glutamate methylesterase/glutaminase